MFFAQGHAIHKWGPSCRDESQQNSPEVLQLLRKTGNAFKQVGDILLKKTGSAASQRPQYGPRLAGGPVPYGVFQHQSPIMYYPWTYSNVQQPQAVPAALPHAQHVYPMQFVPATPLQVPQVSYQVPQATHSHLSNQLVSLACEYEQAAQNECSCGNVEVNMRQGASPLASGKPSDIVVEVTLGDLTQTDSECAGSQSKNVVEEKKTVNIFNISEASEGEEVETDTTSNDTTTFSSASLEEKTVEETEETHSIQVVEAMKLAPETNAIEVETFDNTVKAVEKTIENTVVIKSETEETKTVENSSGETVITIKTYEESQPNKTPTDFDEEISQGTDEEIIDDYHEINNEQIHNSQPYEEKVEVVEVEEEEYEKLKKEASVVSEIFETVDIEESEEKIVQETNVTETKTETVSESQEEDVQIKVIDLESKQNVQKSQIVTETKTETQSAQSGDVEYFEYDYDHDSDCLDKDAKELKQYFPPTPKYISAQEEKDCHLQEGEHVLSEHPQPVENVQVVVKGTIAQTYAEGLQTHTPQQGSFKQQPAGTLHHHEHARPRPVQPLPPMVPCEAHYGLPKPNNRQAVSYGQGASQPDHQLQSQTARNTIAQTQYSILPVPQQQYYGHSASASQRQGHHQGHHHHSALNSPPTPVQSESQSQVYHQPQQQTSYTKYSTTTVTQSKPQVKQYLSPSSNENCDQPEEPELPVLYSQQHSKGYQQFQQQYPSASADFTCGKPEESVQYSQQQVQGYQSPNQQYPTQSNDKCVVEDQPIMYAQSQSKRRQSSQQQGYAAQNPGPQSKPQVYSTAKQSSFQPGPSQSQYSSNVIRSQVTQYQPVQNQHVQKQVVSYQPTQQQVVNYQPVQKQVVSYQSNQQCVDYQPAQHQPVQKQFVSYNSRPTITYSSPQSQSYPSSQQQRDNIQSQHSTSSSTQYRQVQAQSSGLQHRYGAQPQRDVVISSVQSYPQLPQRAVVVSPPQRYPQQPQQAVDVSPPQSYPQQPSYQPSSYKPAQYHSAVEQRSPATKTIVSQPQMRVPQLNERVHFQSAPQAAPGAYQEQPEQQAESEEMIEYELPSTPSNTNGKLTPAQYPPYYFTANQDSVFAPPMLKKQSPASSGRPLSQSLSYSAPTQDSGEDSSGPVSFEVPARYSNKITTFGSPVEEYGEVVADEGDEDSSSAEPAEIKLLPGSSASAQSHYAPAPSSAKTGDLQQLPAKSWPVSSGELGMKGIADGSFEVMDSKSNSGTNVWGAVKEATIEGGD